MDITGRKLFVKALQEEGVTTLFGYPGGTVTDLFDELYKQDGIEVVLPRHEQGLIHEAEGYARSTGKVGVCLVTSGPGATNIMTGLADAHYDSIPLVCFTGQVPLSLIGNDAFQEVDIVGMTRSITKYGVTVRKREDLGRIVKMAFYIASTGKPGPVLIDIPKDIQTAPGPAEYPSGVQIRGYKPNESVHVGQLKKAYKLLRAAKKPLILAGGGINIAHANDKLLQFAEKMHALGSEVIGVRKHKAARPDYIKEVCQQEDLDRLLPKADIVACCMPGTGETAGMFDLERMKKMKPGAILINVGRGSLIPGEALKKMLVEGHLGGAILDVTEEEPLPADSPLWDLPNLLITPHVSGNYHMRQILDTVVKIAGENLEAFLDGKELVNEVDLCTGYRKFKA